MSAEQYTEVEMLRKERFCLILEMRQEGRMLPAYRKERIQERIFQIDEQLAKDTQDA